MTTYIIRRLLLLPIILFGVSLLIFAMLTQLSPTQRVALYVADIPKRQNQLDALIDEYGLNDPIQQQYFRWISNVARGNLGFSKTGKQPVAEMIRERFPATVELTLWAIVPILFIGIRLGIIAALKHNQPTDHVLRIFSIVGTSTPSFVAGLLLLMFFAGYLRWLPTSGRLSPEFQRVVDGPQWHSVTKLITVDAIINGRMDVWVDAALHLLLPAVTLSYISWAVLVRVTRSSMLETLRQDYVRTARSKGLAEHTVIYKHARPNAMLPVVTIGGAILVGLLNGVVITEAVFAFPGIGNRYIEAAQNLDVITVLGLTLFNGSILILGNLAVDFMYAYLDPRVRFN